MSAGSKLKKQSLSRGQEDALASKSLIGIVASINSDSESVIYSNGSKGSKTDVSHPYIGPNSWVRIMPEKGTRLMISRIGEDNEPYISAYFAESQAKGATEATVAGNFYYRSLREGETDMASPGIANVFLSRRGTLELRGGSVSMDLSAEKLEIQARAPTHVRATLGNKRQGVGDEERFGVVVRPGALNLKFPLQPTIRNIVETVPLFYAKEYLRILNSDGPTPGVTMIEHREGDVYDDTGLPILSTKTGLPLRSMTKYGTLVPGISTSTEVDVGGNIAVAIQPTALKGIIVDMPGPTSTLDLLIGKDLLATITQNLTMKVLQTIGLTAAAGIDLTTLATTTIDSKVANIMKGPLFQADTLLVALAQGADTPAMRGTETLAWLLSHTHGTAVGPSGPPLVPPPPTLLSTQVTLK